MLPRGVGAEDFVATFTHAVSVALLDDRRILWEEAFGLVDKNPEPAAQP